MIKVQKFPFFLRRSFYIHCALASLSLLGGKIVLTQQQKLHDQNLELIRASVRVDMVAMPEQTLEELKTMTADAPVAEVKKDEIKVEPKAEVQEVAKAEPKELEKPEINSVEDKHQSFLMKMKHLSGKKITKNQASNKGTESQELKQLVLAGNRLSKGTETYGDSQGADQTAFQVYVSRLPQKVKPYWRLPSFLLNKKFKCRVRVWIAMNGMVSRAEIYQSSGDREYDQKALDAVNSASPFPQLSEDFGKRALNGEILLGFPL
jgi:TonB family protein